MPSVAAQTHLASHLIVVDGCQDTAAALRSGRNSSPVEHVLIPRSPNDRSGPGRSSRLRNWAIRHATTKWVAFLDDDNEWERRHLELVLDAIEACGVLAGHSCRRLLSPDGTPWLEPIWPWSASDEEGRRAYAHLVSLGVVEAGSEVVRGRYEPAELAGGAPGIDTNEWVLARELLLRIPFREAFTAQHEMSLMGEDDLLLEDLIRAKIPVASSGVPTVRYYLGGYSNNRARNLDPEFSWR
jgi:glycosyltransferase involved in cell wall biosynthesis